MSEPVSCGVSPHESSAKRNHPKHPFYKGEKVRYQGEEAVIVSVHPLLVIKSIRRVVCGDLYNYLDLMGEKSPFDENLR
jgi:hypothetical protein